MVFRSQIRSFSFGNSVVAIPAYMCYEMDGLTAITIPNSVTSIGEKAFCGCTGLTAITIPDSVIEIERWAFDDCAGITSIIVESGNPTYDSRDDCNAIIRTETNGLIRGCDTTIIPNSVTYIWNHAFSGCTGLTTITIPNSVTDVGPSAFYGCSGLASIVVERGNTTYDSRDNCNAIIETANNTLIQGCNTTVIPNSVTCIGVDAFKGRIGLMSITIPDSVTNIGTWAFRGCKGLTSIIVERGNPIYDSRDNCNAIIETANNTLIQGCNTTVIPNSVMYIGDSAFHGCAGLISITIPNSVTYIGVYAFYRCTNLKSINLSDNLEVIKEGTFANCDSLKSIIIPPSVKKIGGVSYYQGAFEDCICLTSVTIPNSVTEIGERTFKGCTGLISITIPNSVNTIAKDAFYECKQLRTIRIPKGKKSIFCEDDLRAPQDKIIEYTESLIGDIQYELDDNLTAIVCAKADKYAGDIVIPARVEQDGNTYTIDRLAQDVFRDCYDLTSVTLPKTITEIGADIFSGCENLQTIRVPQGMTEAFCKMGLEPWRDKIVEPRQEEYTILLNIARGYELGIGMARNLAQAVLCYVQAADKGCADAAYHLGELYEEGKALPQDYQQAADWFAKASQLYHPNGEARRQACLRVIEEENARLSAFQEEQRATRQAQLAQLVAAQKPQKTILFFDTETNGLPANYKLGVTATDNWPRLIQLGWIITDESGNILKRKSQLIYPQSFTIDADVTRLTGITTADAQRNGVALSDVLSKFMADVESASLLVGHNVDFDMHIMGCELYRMGMNYQALIEKPSVCTMVRSTNFCALPSTSRCHSGYKYPSLTELYTKLFGYAFSGAHDALSDITATKDCYFELLRRGII